MDTQNKQNSIVLTINGKSESFDEWKSFWERIQAVKERYAERVIQNTGTPFFKAEIKNETCWSFTQGDDFWQFYNTLLDMHLNRMRKEYHGYNHYESIIASVVMSYVPNVTDKNQFMEMLFKAVANSIDDIGTRNFFMNQFVPELIEDMYQASMDGSDVRDKYQNIVRPMVDALLEGHNRFQADETTEIASTPLAMMHELAIIEDMQSLLEQKKQSIMNEFKHWNQGMGRALNRLMGERNF